MTGTAASTSTTGPTNRCQRAALAEPRHQEERQVERAGRCPRSWRRRTAPSVGLGSAQDVWMSATAGCAIARPGCCCAGPGQQQLQRRGELEVRGEHADQAADGGHHEHVAEQLVEPPGRQLVLAQVGDPEQGHGRGEVPGEAVAEDQQPRGPPAGTSPGAFTQRTQAPRSHPDQEQGPGRQAAGHSTRRRIPRRWTAIGRVMAIRIEHAEPERPPEREDEQRHAERPVGRKRPRGVAHASAVVDSRPPGHVRPASPTRIRFLADATRPGKPTRSARSVGPETVICGHMVNHTSLVRPLIHQ